MQSGPGGVRQLTGGSRRGGRQASIKQRVIRLVLVPSVVAVVLLFVASGYLVFNGFYDREVASGVRQVSIPAVTGLSSIEQERRLSVAYLSQPSTGMQSLIDRRRQTDQQLSTLRSAAQSALGRAPASIKSRWKALSDYLDQLPGIRSKIDSGAANRQQVYEFYNGLLDSAYNLFDTQARVVTDVNATQGGIAATEIFRASDLMSRAGSIVTGAFGSHSLSENDYLQLVGLIGSYHALLNDVEPHLRADVRQRYEDVAAGGSWRRLVDAEDGVIDAGHWSGGVPKSLAATAATWDALSTQVSDELIQLTIDQADEVSARALDTGDRQLLTAVLASLIGLALAVGAILWALRQSGVLVDRALSVRLAQLGQDAATVVDQRLPDMMARLRRRERVDPAIELPGKDYGSDEIGQVAAVLNRSLARAVGAAVDEATTREAAIAMLMGVARRPQPPLQRGLKVIEELQGEITDERLLENLFDINHQLAQARRFFENLIILAGGQSGRTFHRPVALRRVLLAAMGEAQQYKRIKLRRTADVALVGAAVAGTTHLLAELFDNALHFSHPESDVWVSCNRVTRGVAVEIEDAGVGMRTEDLNHANELLATAPTPDVAALREGKQIGLSVVAQLAARLEIQVTLRPSAYGGILAVVLLPERLVAAEQDDGGEPALAMSATGRAPLSAPAGAAPVSPPGAGGLLLPQSPPASVDEWTDTHSFPVPVVLADPAPAGAPAFLEPPQGATTALRRRPPLDHPAETAYPHHSSRGAPGAARPVSPSPARGTPPSPSPTERPRLPERRPQQHLAPELRDSPSVPPPSEPARSPEETRDRIARYQQGWAAGRHESNSTTSNDGQDGTA